MSSVRLEAEWSRLELLASIVSAHRQGKRLTPEIRKKLSGLQENVTEQRKSDFWSQFAQAHALEAMDLDVLLCAVAPEAEPRFGWWFQELQPGVNSPYPTPALIQELLVMEPAMAQHLRTRLAPGAPLVRSGLIEGGIQDQYRPLRPTPFACQQLLGWETVDQHIPGALLIPTRCTWTDLVLPNRCARQLQEFMSWIVHRERVVDDWGAPAMGGPIALFAGPSGTGKTMAAAVVASELGWPLYRVDLGLLVSKYIGETEKNLSALFDAADRKPLVLLFDEADSLFGKRGEVKEARDRFSNMGVSHLLSRIERHHGPCILTTNLRQQLDPAFARRFQVVIDFPRPDPVARGALWRQHFPPRAPLGPEVDCDALGQHCELTGGQVRNAALHAAFLAAADNGPIELSHVASAIWTELAKDGRETMRSALGPLAAHLPAR